jgi:Tfp pilus assembly protein PilF
MRIALRKHCRVSQAIVVAVLGVVSIPGDRLAFAQSEAVSREASATLIIRVLDLQRQPLANSLVRLVSDRGTELTGRTDNNGLFRFPPLTPGTYRVLAETNVGEASMSGLVLTAMERKTLDLALRPSKSTNNANTGPSEFFDEPKFTAAGVTDTSNLGGHGSNTRMPTSDALSRATTSLSTEPGKERPSEGSVRELCRQADRNPADPALNARAGVALLDLDRAHDAIPYLERAAHARTEETTRYNLARAYVEDGNFDQAREIAKDLLIGKNPGQAHHLLAMIEEKSGRPLEAAREFQRAAELDPSESNLFEWGSELLLHHAVAPAAEVFSKGTRLFPQSQRMLVGLAIARYSSGDDEQAVQRLCEASDLYPNNPAAYEFMGRILASGNFHSPEVSKRLARFAELHPENALANYYYALSLWKESRLHPSEADNNKIERLLENAVQLDPKLGIAHLQLGILYAERGETAHALPNLRKAVETNPELPDAHYRLARAYSALGEKAKAQHELALYEQTSKAADADLERQRREVQQLVFTLQSSGAPPQ